jgi:hypothetical protein
MCVNIIWQVSHRNGVYERSAISVSSASRGLSAFAIAACHQYAGFTQFLSGRKVITIRYSCSTEHINGLIDSGCGGNGFLDKIWIGLADGHFGADEFWWFDSDGIRFERGGHTAEQMPQ